MYCRVVLMLCCKLLNQWRFHSFRANLVTFNFIIRWDRFGCGCPFDQAISMTVAVVSSWIHIALNIKGMGRADAGGDVLISMGFVV